MNSNETAAPIAIKPWITVWEEETIKASIAHDKVHVVVRSVVSNNAQSGVVDSNAERSETFRAVCGTTRRGRYLAVSSQDEVTCTKCQKHAAR